MNLECFQQIITKDVRCDVLFTASWHHHSNILLENLRLKGWHLDNFDSDIRSGDLLYLDVNSSPENLDIALAFGCSTLPCIVRYDDEANPLSLETVHSVEALELFLSKGAPVNPPRTSASSSTFFSTNIAPETMKSGVVARADVAASASTSTAVAEAAVEAAAGTAAVAAAVEVDPALKKACEELVASGQCVRLFVAGDKTHCGKTTVALGILGSLHAAGVPFSKLAYIKPATQCEAPDLMQKWCVANGLAHCEGADAPLVFFKGFTREFLRGNAGTSQEWIEKVTLAVDRISANKSFVLVDGVGFPAVGSCVGVSNLEVARASRAPVLMVGKCGVGEALDGYSLNSSYFLHGGAPVLGGVFNRGALEGFYHHEACRESLVAFFEKCKPREALFGVVPELPCLEGTRELVPSMALEECAKLCAECVSHVAKHVSVCELLHAAASDPWNRLRGGSAFPRGLAVPLQSPCASTSGSGNINGTSSSNSNSNSSSASVSTHQQQGQVGVKSVSPATDRLSVALKKRSRAEIEAEATAMGAQGG